MVLDKGVERSFGSHKDVGGKRREGLGTRMKPALMDRTINKFIL